MKTKIHTENFGGNMHLTAQTINALGWADYLIQMDCSGHTTVAVFRMPAEMVTAIRRQRGWDNPERDTPAETEGS